MRQITGKTRLVGLIGTPVAHSISPAIQNRAFELLELDYVYLAFDVKEDELAGAVKSLVLLNAAGFNVTMPHKSAIMEYLDVISPAARLAGACNTVVTGEDGKLFGDNTDGSGFMRAAREAGFDPARSAFSIMGAGGAARAIVSYAALCGVRKIYMLRRKHEPAWSDTLKFAGKVTDETGCNVNVADISDTGALSACVSESAMLVNATNAGMGDDGGCALTDESVLRPDLIAADIVYHPSDTPFLKKAREHGCRTLGGTRMLLYQGASAFEKWTGHDMPVDAIRREIYLG